VLTAVGAAALLAAVGVTDVALAGKKDAPKPGKVTKATRSATLGGDQSIGTVNTTCPRRARAISGGFTLTAIPTGVPPGTVYEFQKGGQRGWRASALVFQTPPGGARLTVHAYCRVGAPKTSTASSTVAVPDANQTGVTASASCPRGSKAQSGGWVTPPPIVGAPPTPFITDSLRVGVVGWGVTAISRNTGIGGTTLTSNAYCAKAKKAPSTASATGESVPTPTGVSTVDARCSARRPLAGGFSQAPVAPYPLINADQVWEFQLAGKAWRTSGVQMGIAPPALTSHVYCG
jgi:hypothetical protein